jgi:uncharacterized protein DUF5615
MIGATDEQQLAHSLKQSRILFTQDRDLLRLHASGQLHSGIAYCEKDTKSIGEIIQGLVLIWELIEPDEMANHVEFL